MWSALVTLIAQGTCCAQHLARTGERIEQLKSLKQEQDQTQRGWAKSKYQSGPDRIVKSSVLVGVEIATREGIQKNYVSQLIRLAFLAPEVVEAIADGNQRPDLTAQALIIPPGLNCPWNGKPSSGRSLTSDRNRAPPSHRRHDPKFTVCLAIGENRFNHPQNHEESIFSGAFGSQLTPYTRGFCNFGGREVLIGDWLAERGGFEPSVPAD